MLIIPRPPVVTECPPARHKGDYGGVRNKHGHTMRTQCGELWNCGTGSLPNRNNIGTAAGRNKTLQFGSIWNGKWELGVVQEEVQLVATTSIYYNIISYSLKRKEWLRTKKEARRRWFIEDLRFKWFLCARFAISIIERSIFLCL